MKINHRKNLQVYKTFKGDKFVVVKTIILPDDLNMLFKNSSAIN